MENETTQRVSQTIALCLAECQKSNTPFLTMAAFIESLHNDSTWTNQEILELRTQAIRSLISYETAEAPKRNDELGGQPDKA
jgi:hypothetical protein